MRSSKRGIFPKFALAIRAGFGLKALDSHVRDYWFTRKGLWAVSISLFELATAVSGEIRGAEDREIHDGNSLDKAREGEITFAEGDGNLAKLADCEASAILVPNSERENALIQNTTQSLILVDSPKQAFLQILELFHPQEKRKSVGVSTHAVVHPTASIGANSNIHAGAHIGEDVVIGENCEIHSGVCIGARCRIEDGSTLYPRVVLYPEVQVGQRVIIHAGAVIGADGFGYQMSEGRHEKIRHFGIVRIDDDVEIGANTTIDRAMVGETRIGRGTKIDNLVMIAHNCELGQHNVLASQVGFAGSVTSGDYVICAGQVGIADHVHIGSQSILAAQAGVPKSVEGNCTYFGSPAQPIAETQKQIMAMRRIPKMREEMRALKSQLKVIEAQIQLLNQLLPSEDAGDSASAA